MLDVCCRQLEERLICEGNPNEVTVVCADAMTLDYEEQFDILTMVGSTAIESGDDMALLVKASSFVKDGGAIYCQSLMTKRTAISLSKLLSNAECGWRHLPNITLMASVVTTINLKSGSKNIL